MNRRLFSEAALGILCIWLLLCGVANAQIDLSTLTSVDDSVAVTTTYQSFNRRSGEMRFSTVLTNSSADPIPLPIYLAIDAITSTSVTVVNADDTSLDGTPVLVVGAEPDSLAPGESLSATIVFLNPTRARFRFTPHTFIQTPGLTVLEIEVSSPLDGFLTNGMNTQIQGTVGSGVESVEVNGVSADLSGSGFSASVPLREGNNTITAIARNAAGGIGTDSVVVVRDTTPPTAVIESPSSNQIVTTDTVTVVGTVNDIVTGTVNEQNCQVVVSGRADSVIAAVSNRSFLVEDFPVVPGENTLTAIATDAAGNVSSPFEVQITRQDLVGQRIEVVSGDIQTGVIGEALADPVIVRAIDAQGNLLAGRSLNFRVVRNNGLLTTTLIPEGQSEISVTTDALGQAAVGWILGNRVGAGNNRIEISGVGFAAPALVCASAGAAACDQVLAMSGENQVGVVGTDLSQPFEVIAFDAGGNFCVNTPITFSVEQGGGNFDGANAVTVNTNADGRATAILTLGLATGINNNAVSTTFPALVGQGAQFMASAVEPGPEATTRFVGVVLDTENGPIPNATVQIEDTDPLIQMVTNEDGQFSLDGAPVGAGLLLVDASTTTRSGAWPTLEFQINVIAGIDNSLGRPIFIPELDSDNFRLVGGTTDVELAMDGLEGFSVKIFSNSATFPDGSTTGLMGVTQVSNDQVPMPPSGGAAPPWVGTLQPSGVRFNPPAQVTAPNSLGLPPGQIIDMFSFDHDLQQFVGIGTGTVQADGATIVSDPGSGITKSGWFFDCPPPPPPACSPSCPLCQEVVILDAESCDFRCDPKPDGVTCDDGQECTVNDMCSSGSCVADPVEVTMVDGQCVAAVNALASFNATANDASILSWMSTGGSPSSGTGPTFSTMFAMEGVKTVTASCGTSSQSTTVDVAPACAGLPPRPCNPGRDRVGPFACEGESDQAPDPGNFGQVHRNGHFADYASCADGDDWCFRLGNFTEDHGVGVDVSGVPNNITGAEDSQITSANCTAVIVDFTPVPPGVQGVPAAPYGNYVPEHIVLAHEQAHVTDFRTRVTLPTAASLAAFVAAAANCTDCKTDPPAAFSVEMERLWNANRANYFDGMHEARAYTVENTQLATLVANIRVRGRREGWPAACR